jgi:hypothetical protein
MAQIGPFLENFEDLQRLVNVQVAEKLQNEAQCKKLDMGLVNAKGQNFDFMYTLSLLHARMHAQSSPASLRPSTMGKVNRLCLRNVDRQTLQSGDAQPFGPCCCALPFGLGQGASLKNTSDSPTKVWIESHTTIYLIRGVL